MRRETANIQIDLLQNGELKCCMSKTTTDTDLDAILFLYPPGAFSSRTGIFQTSGSKDRSKVSSSSRQVSSWECRKTQCCYLERFPTDSHECHTSTLPSNKHLPCSAKIAPPPFNREKIPFWICLTSLVLFICELRTNNRHFIIRSIKKNQLAD